MENVLRQYNQMKSQYPNNLILVRDGNFYKTFNEDAQDVSFVTGATIMTARQMKCCVFVKDRIMEYLTKLVRLGFKV